MSADINLDNINADVDLGGSLDLGIDAIAQALTQGIKVDVGLANIVANAKVDVGLDDIQANAKVDVGLDDIKAVAKVDAGLDNVQVRAQADLGLNDIRIRELPTIRFELSMRPIRIHLPLKYSFCLELLGLRLFKFTVCGEGMAITEDNHPR
jgi:hypothetical protein